WRAILSQAGGFEPSGLRVSEERTELWNPHCSLKLAPLVQVDDDQLFEKPRGRTSTGQAEREVGCWCHRRALLVPHRDEQLYARVSDSAQKTWPMRRQLRPATLPERSVLLQPDSLERRRPSSATALAVRRPRCTSSGAPRGRSIARARDT